MTIVEFILTAMIVVLFLYIGAIALQALFVGVAFVIAGIVWIFKQFFNLFKEG